MSTPRRSSDLPSGSSRRSFRLDSGPGRAERDLDEEIDFHIAMRAKRLVDSGLDPVAARAQALRRFGDVSTVRAECLTIDHERERAMQRANHLGDIRQDAGYAVRTLLHSKGFTAIVLLILALGIGANTAMFTLVDALLLRTLPVPGAEQLITIGDPTRTGSLSEGSPRTDLASYPLYADVRVRNQSLRGIYASGRTGRLDVIIDRDSSGGARSSVEAEHPRGRFVSGSYFSVLQLQPSLGRTFAADEDRVPGDDPVVVISHDYWRRRFAGDRSVIGRTILANGTPLTIVGVGPAGFTGDIVGQSIELWIPLMMQPAVIPHTAWLDDRGINWLLMMGRLKPGVTIEQARSDISAVMKRSLIDNATGNQIGSIERRLGEGAIRVESGARGFSYYRSAYSSSLLTLMAAVGLVLLIACANIANLLLARASARGREMSVRMALGAGRSRLVRQLFTESVILAATGGALGLLVAYWGSRALLSLAGGSSAIPLDARIDGRVLAFSALLSLLTALLFGLVPALRATRVELATALRTQGRGVAGVHGRPGRVALGKLLVVAQVALSMLLLVGTGMLVRSVQRLQNADLGLASDRLVIAGVDAQRAGYSGPRLATLIRDLGARMERIPGVRAVSYSENGLFSGTESRTTLQVEGYTARADSDTLVAYDDVGPGYFHVIGARLLQGRDFEARDNETGPKVAVVNQTAASFFFPDGDALGRRITTDSTAWEIVGVVADVEEQGVREGPERRVYFPMMQMERQPGEFYLELRAEGDPARLVVPVRRALQAADPALMIRSVDPLTELIGDSISRDRMVAQVVTFFGTLALVLAALGLYGVMAYATIRRTSEFGLRMALGAQPGDVTRLMLHEALLLTIAGVVIGLPIALATTRLLEGQLFEVGVLDVPSIVAAVTVLAISAAAAGLLPAMRASRVPPLEALRAE